MEQLEVPKTSFFKRLMKANRQLELCYELATINTTESTTKVRSIVSNFMEGYTTFNQITEQDAVKSFMKTIRRYVDDIRAYIATGKYPLEINAKQWDLSRTDYDLFLMITILVTPHRCAIMEEIMKLSTSGRTLVIGVGSGIELSFIYAPQGSEAYDLYINPFARQTFSKFNFHEKWYYPSKQFYENVYAIELLEHLDEPYAFIKNCHQSLNHGGRFVATTATNVPQFDHRYNFTSEKDFEEQVCAQGFEMESKRLIPHNYKLMNIKANNIFYVFRKKTDAPI